tara:strand:+ start:1780 stop:2202 length:423 start_codon:yes stop_codon:yes gene_type:complete
MTEEDLKKAEKEFFATVKLISGEEVLAQVCYLPDEDKVILNRPLQVELAKQRKGNVEIAGFSLREWVAATFDEMFIVNRNHILTMSELDKNIELFYHQTLGRIENGKNLTHGAKKLPRKSGYLGSITEKKQKLEDIFKKS